MSSKPQFSTRSFLLFFAIFVFAILLTTWYVSAEHVFYWWDYALYMEMAFKLSRMFMQDPLEALRIVYSSTRFDYNYYFALPLIPFIELFHYSRLGFILGLVLVYHLPMLVVAGGIVKRVFRSCPFAPWAGILMGLFVPALWASVFRGLPDAGGVLLVGMAALVYLKDMELKRWYLQLPLIGLLAGFSIIFRRHFAYNVTAFIFSISGFLTYFSLRRAGWNWRNLWRECWGILVKMQILAAFLLFTLVLFAPALVMKMIVINYVELYASYEKSPIEVAIYFLSAYGVLWIVAVLGFLLSLLTKKLNLQSGSNRSPDQGSLLFCLVYGVTTFLLWVFVPRQINLHYSLHVSLLIIVGVSAFFFWVWPAFVSYRHWATVLALVFLLGINLWTGLTPTPPVHFLTTQNFPPLYREDYDEVVRLVDYLREHADESSKIFVAASSPIMNSKILRNAEVAARGEQAFLNVLFAPEIDSRDFYPLENLVNADYIIVTDPVQYHLRADQQKVVGFVDDLFRRKLQANHDFRKLPETFALRDGAILSVYQRQSPAALTTILATFGQMSRYIGRVPGGQPDWMLITALPGMDSKYQVSGKEYSVSLSNDSLPRSFLYVDRNSVKGHITGVAKMEDGSCGPVQITLSVYSASGSILELWKTTMVTTGGSFSIDFSKISDAALVLTFQRMIGTANGPCRPVLTWETIR